MKIGISGATGKTGYRIVEEAIKGGHAVKQLIRKDSTIKKDLKSKNVERINIFDEKSIDNALQGLDVLIIATGARPAIDLTGPARIDYKGVVSQVNSCKRVGIKRIILVSSLCTGKLFHPLNLFGLILIWKKLGENHLKNNCAEWSIIRPGGLKENEDITNENILYTSEDLQFEGSIPRRLVAKCCVNIISEPLTFNKTIEITSSPTNKKINLKKALGVL
tara:strand:- start:22237 stop:22896 length:660 start_codon:yes stop_codon:yes gene_type:complete